MAHDHLRFAGATPDVQERVLVEMIRGQPHLMHLLEGIRALALPDGLLCSGAIYNTVWNVLTDRPPLMGINDADVAYFDGGDTSFEAEDRCIREAGQVFENSPLPVQVRNQARVHLWFSQRFGFDYPQLGCSAEMLRYFATRTHAVAARLTADGRIVIDAPFGLDDMFAFRLTPNPVLPNRDTHLRKAERAKAIWPELIIVPWP